ncbi:MAG: putative nicotinate-nucleotide adenylyltransferase [Microgenomates group bacterium GW2011_GWA1_46_15]|nr:MAG: putative nicotinate-nucleotide adenylyltransferase [Microgenomates group bacterium GW2011_GWB1_45_17]KKU23378.1 MAG: putative nicotinate-nucleotide adenylyltransferase [Microgenomates group bacterium GW2011_GWA1_46_15]KKU24492.1 MAG: putative nicotinate-nucleotide adenylyltransferase [Microgenomates group bacterium GW2011_GWC1_46_15]
MHITLFGGSFDPPHNGHLKVADHIIQANVADEAWFVPCAKHPFAKHLSPTTHRIAMLKLLHAHTINLFEAESHRPSYSIDTLNHFAVTQPQDSFSWLIGSDQLPLFPKWHHYTELLQKFKIYVYPRTGFPLNGLLPGMVGLTTMPTIDISSTEVRARVKNNQSLHNLVPPAVTQYIQENRLYVG